MPSFDVVSEVDAHELRNAVDQANREFGQRFDFKGSGATIEQEGLTLTLHAANEFQLDQMLDVFHAKLAKRNVDLDCLAPEAPELSGQRARQRIVVRQGIDTDLGRKLVKLVKDGKLKVQAAIQGDQVRVTGKKRDDLQAVIAVLRGAKLGIPLQFINFRD
jgi:uncharacterized protein YajQ (UPF0234 family)